METIESKVKELFKLLEIEAEVTVSETDEAFTIAIDAKDDNALLIGKHGNTLTSLEYIIYILCVKTLETPKRILVEIGGYREERETYLAELAGRLKDEVISTGVEKTVRGLKPWERRHVHMVLSEDTEVMTESEGEDRDRVLVIKKKS
ncbi:MAG: KH domain-containing protein [Candidatus Levybacteria bacterium]|nr:KH domain-containing protein [Candidatus Levybacteria bacterium]